jgi:PAS domain S-box-containing protein
MAASTSSESDGGPEPARWGAARDAILNTLLGDGAENVELGVFIYDDDGKYVAVNAHACELLGYPREELLTHHVGDFTPEGAVPDRFEEMNRREGVRVVRRKDGSEVAVAYVVAPTRVSTFAFHLAVVWELDADDHRVTGVR